MERIKDVLAKYQIAFFQEKDLERVFAVHESREAFIEWMREYLQTETFLTAEEVKLYGSPFKAAA